MSGIKQVTGWLDSTGKFHPTKTEVLFAQTNLDLSDFIVSNEDDVERRNILFNFIWKHRSDLVAILCREGGISGTD